MTKPKITKTDPVVTLFQTADYVTVSRENKLSVMGMFSEVNAEKLPFRIPMFFTVIKWESGLGDFVHKFEMVNPDGKVLFEKETRFTLGLHASNHVCIHGLDHFQFDKAGKYQLKVSLNGELVSTRWLMINQIIKQ